MRYQQSHEGDPRTHATVWFTIEDQARTKRCQVVHVYHDAEYNYTGRLLHPERDNKGENNKEKNKGPWNLLQISFSKEQSSDTAQVGVLIHDGQGLCQDKRLSLLINIKSIDEICSEEKVNDIEES